MIVKFMTVAALVFAILSAISWGLSARVNFSFGYDMDEELRAATRKASSLNAFGALFAALSATCQGAAIFFQP
jgi:hypothetical protein